MYSCTKKPVKCIIDKGFEISYSRMTQWHHSHLTLDYSRKLWSRSLGQRRLNWRSILGVRMFNYWGMEALVVGQLNSGIIYIYIFSIGSNGKAPQNWTMINYSYSYSYPYLGFLNDLQGFKKTEICRVPIISVHFCRMLLVLLIGFY